jgi:hypothetical protein
MSSGGAQALPDGPRLSEETIRDLKRFRRNVRDSYADLVTKKRAFQCTRPRPPAPDGAERVAAVVFAAASLAAVGAWSRVVEHIIYDHEVRRCSDSRAA